MKITFFGEFLIIMRGFTIIESLANKKTILCLQKKFF